MSCTCDGSIFLDSMCTPCLLRAEQQLTPVVEKKREELEELVSQLEWIQWHIDNPLCSNGCGENTAHCLCDEGDEDEKETP